ncbi:hypothetical protein [Solibacillus sp. NPDC093137]
MKEKIYSKSSAQKMSSYVIPVFIGAGIGGLLGLVAYVKDWL